MALLDTTRLGAFLSAFSFYHHQNIDVSAYLYAINASDLSMSIASGGGSVSFATLNTSSFSAVLRVSKSWLHAKNASQRGLYAGS